MLSSNLLKREQKKDILWVNYLKALCILGVYFVHSNQYYGFNLSSINKFVHPFYVNAFFFISGYLLFRKQLSAPLINQNVVCYALGGGRQLVSNIFWKLMIPTVLFSIIEFFPSHVIRGYEFGIGTFLYKTVGGCTYWFTAALVVAELVIVCLLLTRARNIWFYLLSGCIAFFLGYYFVINDFYLFKQYPSFPWHYQQGLFAIPFMCLGGVFWKYEKYVAKFLNFYILVGLIGVYTLCLCLWPNHFHMLISTLNMNVLGIAISILSILILIGICGHIPYSSLLNYIGQNTIGLYFMSGALPIILSLVMNRLFYAPNLIGFVIVFSVSFGIGLFAVFLMNRVIPWIFDLRLLFRSDR